jgi:eukaryotic-like serine/threonine-protein kinase
MSMPETTESQHCGKCGMALCVHGLCAGCLLESAFGEEEADENVGRTPLLAFDDYKLLEEIARGGMGVVYRARQISLNRIVAIKMILGGHLANAAEMKRFRAEAETAAHLQHPNIVAIHEVGEYAGQPFFTMDLVEGRSMAQVARDEPLSLRKAAGYLKTIAEAVQYAHSRGVLHRDLKPSNILIDETNQPRITDFGLAKRIIAQVSPAAASYGERPEGFEENLTLSGQALGSPNFMPPEQAAGKHRELTPAADVYSLGALLYNLITGRPPFLADSIPATLRLVAETEPVAPRLLNPAIPRDLETICLKCLEKDSRRRYSTAQELADELGCFLRDEPIRARALGGWEKLQRWTRRRPVVAGLIGAVGVLLVGIAVVSTVAVTRLRRANQEGQEKLREAYLSQAHANRWSGRPGRRFDSLDVIRKAAQIRPGIDLRNEAIAAMALVDLRESKEWRISLSTQFFGYKRCARIETNGTIVVRRIRDDVELLRLPGFGLPAQDVAISHDDRYLGAVYGEEDAFAFKVYDLSDSGKGKLIIDLPDRWVRCFHFLPERPRLAVVMSEGQKNLNPVVAFYDLETGQALNSIPLLNPPFGLATSPDGCQFAVSSTESPFVDIYSLENGQKLQTLTHSNQVYAVSWSRDGRRLAAACADQSVYLWDLTVDPPLATGFPPDGEPVWSPFTQRGDLLMSWGWNSILKVWDTGGGEFLRCPVDGEGFFKEDVNRLDHVSLSEEMLHGLECRAYYVPPNVGGSWDVVLAPDGRWMASGHRDGLRFWNLATGRETHYSEAGDTRGLQLAPDGESLITESNRDLMSWPIRSREKGGIIRIEVGPPVSLSRDQPESVHPVNRMVSVDRGDACIFDPSSLRIERRLTDPKNIHTAAISPDGRHCAIWVRNASAIDIWDVESGQRVVSLPVPHSPCVGFSPDGRWLLTGSAEEYIFWDCASWKRRKSIPRGKTGGSHGKFAFTRDGRTVALALGAGEIGLFETSTFESLATLESPEVGNVAGLDFSADGARLAVSTNLRSIHVWDFRVVRHRLAELKLDFDRPPIPAAVSDGPVKISIIRTAPAAR